MWLEKLCITPHRAVNILANGTYTQWQTSAKVSLTRITLAANIYSLTNLEDHVRVDTCSMDHVQNSAQNPHPTTSIDIKSGAVIEEIA